MVKFVKIKAFTLLELMVSIFITITIIASFYKLYEASLKTERSAAIRVSVNLLGEQILNTLADSMKMIGLNSQKGDLNASYDELSSPSSVIKGIFRQNGLLGTYGASMSLNYVSPYGSPITKISGTSTASSDKFPNCTSFNLFNSAAFHKDIKKLYFHTQYGVVPANVNVTPGSDSLTVSVQTFSDDAPSISNKSCKSVFPVGTLVTGEDFFYTLEYSPGSDKNHLYLVYKPADGGDNNFLLKFDYDKDSPSSYSMPRFSMQFLRERVDGEGNITRNWVTNVAFNNISEVIAVRFGFIILSKKERVYRGEDSPSSDLPEYCIFDEKDHDTECYKLPSLNYTASVFRRVVYLANFKMLVDSANIK